MLLDTIFFSPLSEAWLDFNYQHIVFLSVTHQRLESSTCAHSPYHALYIMVTSKISTNQNIHRIVFTTFSQFNMISPKRLLQLARKWKKVVALGRRRLSSKIAHGDDSDKSDAAVASKGHFVAYTMDAQRFELPLTCLKSNVFRELFRTSEELFGLLGDQPITLPCDSTFMELTIAFLQDRSSNNVERSLFKSIPHSKVFSFLVSLSSTVTPEHNSTCFLRNWM